MYKIYQMMIFSQMKNSAIKKDTATWQKNVVIWNSAFDDSPAPSLSKT